MKRSHKVGLLTLILVLVIAACSPPPPLPTPEAVADSYLVRADDSLSVAAPGILGNDSIEQASLLEVNGVTAAVGNETPTDDGTVTVSADGSFHYEPNLGFVGTDSFTYTVGHAQDSDTATVTLEVVEPLTKLPDATAAVSRAAGVFAAGSFYVLGGEGIGGARDGLVQILDTASNTWSAGEPMPTPVSNICAAVLGDHIYVPGGYNGDGLDLLRRYDINADTWSVIDSDPLPAVKYANACASLNGKLYLFGGSNSGLGSTDVWSYDPSLEAGERWTTTLAPSPIAGAYGAAVAAGDRIFYSGMGDASGSTNSAAVLAYLPASDSWVTYPSLQTARSAASVWVSGSHLFVAGGGWSSYLNTVEVYDLNEGTEGTWAYSDELLTGRRTAAAASDPLTGAAYIAAGWNGNYVAEVEVARVMLTP